MDATTSAEITLLLQPDAAPALTSDQMTTILAVADAQGVRAALALGWRTKMALCAGAVDVRLADGTTLSRSQLYAACSAQAALYADRGIGSMPTTVGRQW